MTVYKKKTSARLKQIARGLMLGKYRNAITLLLANDLLLSSLSLFAATASNSVSGLVIGLFINFIIALLGNILQVGQCSFYLNIASGQHYNFSDLFTGLKVYPDKTILTSLVVLLLCGIPLLPATVLLTIFAFLPDMVVLFLSGCILLVAGGMLSCWLALRFSQIPYLLLDFPESSSVDLLRSSWKLMSGNCGRLFYLHVSFLPLTFVGLLTFGIGFLFITPYQSMTYTLFYLDMIKQSE